MSDFVIGIIVPAFASARVGAPLLCTSRRGLAAAIMTRKPVCIPSSHFLFVSDMPRVSLQPPPFNRVLPCACALCCTQGPLMLSAQLEFTKSGSSTTRHAPYLAVPRSCRTTSTRRLCQARSRACKTRWTTSLGRTSTGGSYRTPRTMACQVRDGTARKQ